METFEKVFVQNKIPVLEGGISLQPFIVKIRFFVELFEDSFASSLTV